MPILDTFTALTDDDVAEVFKSLPNKYCALDPVSAELYKQCLQHLCSYIKYIVNLSLSQGIVPTLFKEALVKPKLKSHTLDKDMLKNFRPLSNLSFMSKSLERSAFKQLVGHLESNKLFSNFQSAYQKYHSCETAITKITNDILHSLENKRCSFLLFLDLSSAFDTQWIALFCCLSFKRSLVSKVKFYNGLIHTLQIVLAKLLTLGKVSQKCCVYCLGCPR